MFQGLLPLLLVLVVLVPLGRAGAHEVDQYTVPDEAVADTGAYLNEYMIAVVEKGIDRANTEIWRLKHLPRRAFNSRAGQRTGKGPPAPRSRLNLQWKLNEARSAAGLALHVRSTFPNAVRLIEGLDHKLESKSLRGEFDGQRLIYKAAFFDSVYIGLYYRVDPRWAFRLWRAGSAKFFGHRVGTDKIGHLVDMGYHYFQKYHAARKGGRSEADAMARAAGYGTSSLLLSERSLLGYLTAGAYSNADLASNFAGMLFYRNLAEDLTLDGETWPAMVRLNAKGYWELAPHVRDTPNFFGRFVTEHFDEVLNPSLYEKPIRPKLRRALAKRLDPVRGLYVDESGDPRTAEWFHQRYRALRTLHGLDYGHRGKPGSVITLADVIEAGQTRVNRADED